MTVHPSTQLPPWGSVLAVVAHPDDESFASARCSPRSSTPGPAPRCYVSVAGRRPRCTASKVTCTGSEPGSSPLQAPSSAWLPARCWATPTAHCPGCAAAGSSATLVTLSATRDGRPARVRDVRDGAPGPRRRPPLPRMSSTSTWSCRSTGLDSGQRSPRTPARRCPLWPRLELLGSTEHLRRLRAPHRRE